MNQGNLPKWAGASHCYSKAYALLAHMGRNGHVATFGRKCYPSVEMLDLIGALNEGNEERIKALLMFQRNK